MATKTYSSLYKIKEFLMNNIAPKYLKDEEINISQIGLFGYITESLSVLGEDALNATSIVFKECFANVAENLESLYLMSSIYQLDNYFATAASMPFIIILNVNDVINNSVSKDGFYTFNIDKNTEFYINDLRYSLEYDIKIISTRNKAGEYIFNCQYNMENKLSFGTIKNPYIRSKVQSYNGTKYLALLVELRQFVTREYTETIVSNDRINFSEFNFDIGTDNMCCGFEIFYTPSKSTENEVQMIKKMENTPKEVEPFYYYSMVNSETLRITFNNDEKFFIPEFNSTIRVIIYTTSGTVGNFQQYEDDDIRIITSGNRFPENNGLIMFGQCAGSSSGGTNTLTMDEFRDQVVTAQSTVLSYTTDKDLELYFKKLITSANTQIMFMKREDDSLIRLFNAFTLLKDENRVVLPTNTCTLMLREEDLDVPLPETFRCIIKPNKIYTYSEIHSGCLSVNDSINISDNLDKYEDTFVYVNPFLLIGSAKPVNCGVYLNSVDENIFMESYYVNMESYAQFNSSGIDIYRNAVLGEDTYKFDVQLLPTAEFTEVCVEEFKADKIVPSTARTFIHKKVKYVDYKKIAICMVFKSKEYDIGYIDFKMSGIDSDKKSYKFSSTLKTNDFVSSNNTMQVIDSLKDMNTGEILSEAFIPNSEITIDLLIFFKYDEIENEYGEMEDINIEHEYNMYTDYTLTNIYRNIDNKMDLIKPLNMIRSSLIYTRYVKEDNSGFDYYYKFLSVPVVKANYIKKKDLFNKFITNITTIYEYLQKEVDKLTNNFSIDIKFYNTYGRSRHYMIDTKVNNSTPNLPTGKTYLDNINIVLKFGIRPYYTTDIDNLTDTIKTYILNYLETDFGRYGNNTYYNSNLMRSLENEFKDKIEYIVFKGINDYSLLVQTLEPIITSENIQNYYDKMIDYIPEYVNIYYKQKGNKSTPQILIEIL